MLKICLPDPVSYLPRFKTIIFLMPWTIKFVEEKDNENHESWQSFFNVICTYSVYPLMCALSHCLEGLIFNSSWQTCKPRNGLIQGPYLSDKWADKVTCLSSKSMGTCPWLQKAQVAKACTADNTTWLILCWGSSSPRHHFTVWEEAGLE